MNCLPIAATVALYKPDDEDSETELKFVISPSLKIQKCAIAVATFVFDSSKMNLLSSYMLGDLCPAKYQECLLLAKAASTKTLEFFRDSIAKKLSADIR